MIFYDFQFSVVERGATIDRRSTAKCYLNTGTGYLVVGNKYTPQGVKILIYELSKESQWCKML